LGGWSCGSRSRSRGSYFPSFLEPRRLSEQAQVAVVQQAWVLGISTRKVDDLVQALGMTGISKSQVSRLCAELDERVRAFLERPLEGVWPYLWLDATYLKCREAGRVVSKACVVAVGVNGEGRREVLGLAVGPAETHGFWKAFLRGLIRRGLRGVRLVVSDAHEGLRKAVGQVLGATWQRCRVGLLKKSRWADSLEPFDGRRAGCLGVRSGISWNCSLPGRCASSCRTTISWCEWIGFSI